MQGLLLLKEVDGDMHMIYDIISMSLSASFNKYDIISCCMGRSRRLFCRSWKRSEMHEFIDVQYGLENCRSEDGSSCSNHLAGHSVG